MAILYGKEGTYDLRDLGFDRSLVRGISSAGTDPMPPDMQNVFSAGVSSAQLGSQAVGKDISLGHQVITVTPSDNLQEAIETLSSRGGGTLKLGAFTYTLTYDIEIRSNINVVGEGRDVTILEFSGAVHGMKMIGTASSIVKNTRIADLTIQNSNNEAGFDVDYVDFWRMENVRVTSCSQRGVRIQHSEHFVITNVRTDDNGSDGLEIVGDASPAKETQYFTFFTCSSDNNGGRGFDLRLVNSTPTTVICCTAEGNVEDGFALQNNTGRYVKFIGCSAETNNGLGFNFNADHAVMIGCFSEGNIGGGVDFEAQGSVLFGCTILDGVIFPDESIFARGNEGYITETRESVTAKNTSGGSLVVGDVVIIKSVASGKEVTTTTVAGDDKVFGMCLGQGGGGAILNDAEGQFLLIGKTSSLKVDGTTDIAIGDFLSTFTTAKIAAKASAGDMVFAIALEAYTTNDSLGVIDALLFSPRLI